MLGKSRRIGLIFNTLYWCAFGKSAKGKDGMNTWKFRGERRKKNAQYSEIGMLYENNASSGVVELFKSQKVLIFINHNIVEKL